MNGCVANVVNPDDLRTFKHDLRTPINHILGYSDLLLEMASDVDDRATMSMAGQIHKIGVELASTVERLLATVPVDTDAGGSQRELLCRTIRPVIEKIVRLLSASPELFASDAWHGDLERIRRAACQLMASTQSCDN
jgi:signal transduction histidine kinase